MKKATIFSVLLIISLSIFASCSNDDGDGNNNSGNIPANGWRIGTTNYTTLFSLRDPGSPNQISFFDALPIANNLNSTVVIFNNTTGISAGTFKVVIKANESDLLADEIMVAMGTGYSQTSGLYDKSYATVIGQTVNATVTITGGKVKIVVPQINIIQTPINASSATSNFAGTLVEQ